MVLRAHFKRLTTFTQEFWQYVHRTAPLKSFFTAEFQYDFFTSFALQW